MTITAGVLIALSLEEQLGRRLLEMYDRVLQASR
jgi:hypothetical protein